MYALPAEPFVGIWKTAVMLPHTVSTVGVDAEAAIALVPKPIANTVLPSKVVRVNLRVWFKECPVGELPTCDDLRNAAQRKLLLAPEACGHARRKPRQSREQGARVVSINSEQTIDDRASERSMRKIARG